MDIAINVRNQSGTINGVLDIGEADLNVIYQLSDITEPQKRKANYVRKFTIPGTKNNNQIFNGISEQGYSVHIFNPNKKLDAQVIFDGNIMFEGALQLNKILKDNDNQKIGYEITIYGSLADFFNDIKDANLSEIDFSEYNHNMIRENIMASWALKVPYYIQNVGPQPPSPFTGAGYTLKSMDGYIYKNGIKRPFELGEGYVYPFINKGQTSMNLGTSTLDWTPAMYVRTIMRKIFEKWGWTWKSKFFDSETFRKLIIPYGKEKITTDFFASLSQTSKTETNSQFIANIGAPANPGILLDTKFPTAADTTRNLQIKFTNDSEAPATDPGNLYNTTTGCFVPEQTFKYSLFANVILNLQIVPQSNVKIYYQGNNISATVRLCDITDWNPTGSAQSGSVITKGTGTITDLASTSYTFPLNKKEFTFEQMIPKTIFVKYEGTLTANRKYAVLVNWDLPSSSFQSAFFDIGAGKDIGGKVKLFASAGVPSPSQTDSSRFYSTITQDSVEYNQTVNMNKILDSSIKVSDFIVSINNLFNLYWKPSTNNPKQFIIEPRDTFYNDAYIQDWTDKIDHSEPITIEPLYELTANKYIFEYKEDADYLNDDYQLNFGEPHGSKRLEVANDFIDREEKISPNFSPSPMFQFAGTEIISPGFIKKDGSKYAITAVKSRILFYGGMVPTKLKDVNTLISFSQTGANNKFVVVDQDRAFLYMDRYPYCGHYDHPMKPTESLEYGASKKTYYMAKYLDAQITNNNLFNKYWRRHFLETTDPDGHLFSATAILTSMDIAQLDLTGIIEVNFVKYRINKIVYNPITYIAEIELVKKLDTGVFIPTSVVWGDVGGWAPNPGTPGGWDGPIGGGYPGIYKGWLGREYINSGWDLVNSSTSYKNADWFFPNPSIGGNTSWSQAVSTPKAYGAASFRINKSSSQVPVPSLSARRDTWSDFVPEATYTLYDSTTSNIYYRQQNQVVQGENNIIAAGVLEVAVRGSSNTIAQGARKINIVGDRNTIMPGVENVSIVGSGHTIEESNVSIIQGVKMVNGVVSTAKIPLISGNDVVGGRLISGGVDNVLIGSGITAAPRSSRLY